MPPILIKRPASPKHTKWLMFALAASLAAIAAIYLR